MAVNLHLPEVRKPAVQPAPNDTPGTCKRQGCGRPFTGPRNRRYCDEHSPWVKYVGRAAA